MKARINLSTAPGFQLPRIGKIKVGMKNERGLPQSVDYFIATGNYAKHFEDVYGKSNRVTVCFLSDDPMESCREQLVYFDKGGKIAARGDGETFDVWNAANEQYETLTTAEHPDIMEQIEKRFPSTYGWSHELTLNFLLPKVRSVIGYWTFTTRGKESTIPQIRGAFDSVLAVVGHVKMMPFDLIVDFAGSMKPGQKKRFPVVSLVPNADKENMTVMENYTKRKAIKPVGLEDETPKQIKE